MEKGKSIVVFDVVSTTSVPVGVKDGFFMNKFLEEIMK